MFELDLYWIIYGNENPLAYLSEHANASSPTTSRTGSGRTRPDADDFEDAGPGRIDFPDIFAVGTEGGPDEHYFIEHDQPLLSHPRPRDAEGTADHREGGHRVPPGRSAGSSGFS